MLRRPVIGIFDFKFLADLLPVGNVLKFSNRLDKGPQAAEEIPACERAFRELKCTVDTVDYDVPWGERCIVRAVKNGETPRKYPRKAGSIEKAPL